MPANLAERGISLAALQARQKQSEARLDAHRDGVSLTKSLLGASYDRYGNVEDHRKEQGLVVANTSLTELVTQGKKLERAFDGEVRLPQVPDVLLDPEGVKTLTDAKLRPVMIPGFEGLDPKELARISEGKPSRFDRVLPRDYLEGVASGEFPRPGAEPYILYVDGVVNPKPDGTAPTTRLSTEAGLGNLAHTPIVDVKRTVRRTGQQALSNLGLDSSALTVKPISTREAGIVAAIKGQRKEVVTNTRIFGTDTHVVFEGDGVRTTDGTQNGTPPRLTVVENDIIRPERYLPSAARRRARAAKQ